MGLNVAQYPLERLPHAMLFVGDEGVGKLAAALDLAQRLLCSRGGEQVCGECGACHRVQKLMHPDLHFSFPFIKRSQSTTSDEFLAEWRNLLGTTRYFGFDDWLRVMGDEGKNALITEAEADNILHKLGLTAFEGGRKVLIMWLPERMNAAAANNLLKMLEEPPRDTYIIMVSNDTRLILPTILSRAQQVRFARMEDETIQTMLQQRNGLEEATARDVARQAAGSYLRALRLIDAGSRQDEMFDKFARLMRLAYARNVGGLEKWSIELGGWSRERLRAWLGYAQRMVRENFVYNFHRPELNYLGEREARFARKFAPFVNERNVRTITTLLGRAELETIGNVTARTLLFSLAMQMIIALRA